MSQLLSQKEVELLLNEASDVALPSRMDQVSLYDSNEVVSYDLAHQNRVVRGRMPALEMVHSRFARILRQTLSSHLRRPFNIWNRATELVNFKDFIQSISYPASLNLFRLSPLRGPALFVLEQKLVYTFIDLMFGGTGEYEVQQVKKDFTNIEMRMISKVVHSALNDLQKAWQPFIPLKVRFDQSETNPQLISNMLDDTEIVVITTFDVELNKSPMTLSICLPYNMLDPIRSRLNAGYRSESLETNQVTVAHLTENVRKTLVDIRVYLGSAKIPLKRFLNINIGDHIILEQDSDKPLDILVENVPKFRGFQGAYKGQRAIKIAELLYEPRSYDNLFSADLDEESTED